MLADCRTITEAEEPYVIILLSAKTLLVASLRFTAKEEAPNVTKLLFVILLNLLPFDKSISCELAPEVVILFAVILLFREPTIDIAGDDADNLHPKGKLLFYIHPHIIAGGKTKRKGEIANPVADTKNNLTDD